jgi:cytoskeletal protein RodZ
MSDEGNKSSLSSSEEEEEETTKAQRVVKYNEKFNVPEQTEEEESKTHENAEVEHLADNSEIKRRKRGL